MSEPAKQESERKNETFSPASSPTSRADLKSIAIFALIIIGVVALGLIAVNQFLEFRYKSVFLQTPCELCSELNPRLESCFKDRLTVYTDPITGEEIGDIEAYKKNHSSNTQFIIPNLSELLVK